MDKSSVEVLVRDSVLRTVYGKTGKRYIPVAVSSRHAHVSQRDLELLFGMGHALHPIKPLSQPGQYVCRETVTVAGPKGSLQNVRIVGPVRGETQVEISLTDTYTLGVPPVVRMSGDISGTPGAVLIGPMGRVRLSQGVIISQRHLHISPDEAGWMGLTNADTISVVSQGERPVVFKDVVVRAGETYRLEMHIDTDEANAANIRTGALLMME
jgi:putative phosphotransacetylase